VGGGRVGKEANAGPEDWNEGGEEGVYQKEGSRSKAGRG